MKKDTEKEDRKKFLLDYTQLDNSWKQNAFLYARSLMGSFVPKHEHKELVCAMIFEECLIL